MTVRLVTAEELERMGYRMPPPPEGLELPTVDRSVAVDDEDAQQCRIMNEDEIYPMHINNPVSATPVQPDVWTLETDNEYVTLTYENGVQYTVRLGDIDMTSGPEPTRYLKTGGLVYPMDGDTLLLNGDATPRLAQMRAWVLEQTLRISEDRLKMAELVNEFATQIGRLGSARDSSWQITKQ